MKLYHRDDCPFCWKVRIALNEAGATADLETIPRGQGGRLSHLTPQASVPVLVDGAVVVWESAVIVEYVAALHPAAALIPSDPALGALARSIEVYSDRLVGPNLLPVIQEKRMKAEPDWDRERIAKGEDGWRANLDWLEAALDGRAAFAGSFSVAECALLPRFFLAETFDVGVDDRHPGLARWFETHRQRPSAVAAG